MACLLARLFLRIQGPGWSLGQPIEIGGRRLARETAEPDAVCGAMHGETARERQDEGYGSPGESVRQHLWYTPPSGAFAPGVGAKKNATVLAVREVRAIMQGFAGDGLGNEPDNSKKKGVDKIGCFGSESHLSASSEEIRK